MQYEWTPELVFLPTRHSNLGVTGNSDTQSLLLVSNLFYNLVLVAVTADGMVETEFSVLLW